MSDEPREIRGFCGHAVGTLTGPILVTVMCRECGEYVGTEWRDGKPVITATQVFEPTHGGTVKVDTWSDGDVRVTVTEDEDTWAQAVFAALAFAEFRELLDRAATPGQPCQRPCCDHCNNREGDPDGHDYTLSGPHDGPCEQCAEEQARREHDEGTG